MGRPRARFRISINDQETSRTLKVELIETAHFRGEQRFRLRVNGRTPTLVPEATLTQVLNRLRQWTVQRVIPKR